MLTEENALWIRMSLDRQLLGLNHALLWLQLSADNTYHHHGLFDLLNHLAESLSTLQPLLQPSQK